MNLGSMLPAPYDCVEVSGSFFLPSSVQAFCGWIMISDPTHFGHGGLRVPHLGNGVEFLTLYFWYKVSTI